MNNKLSQSKLAKALGLAKSRVTAMKKMGMPVHSLEAAKEWRTRNVAQTSRVQAPQVIHQIEPLPFGTPVAAKLGILGGAVSLDLIQERARLAQSQRVAQELKNDIARGEYAPVGLLADVLAMASSAVVDRFDQLEGALRKACPTLPDDAKATVMQVIASARNEWIRSTSKLVNDTLDTMVSDDEGGTDDFDEDTLTHPA